MLMLRRHIWEYVRSILLYQEKIVAAELCAREDVDALSRELGMDLAAPFYQ